MGDSPHPEGHYNATIIFSYIFIMSGVIYLYLHKRILTVLLRFTGPGGHFTKKLASFKSELAHAYEQYF